MNSLPNDILWIVLRHVIACNHQVNYNYHLGTNERIELAEFASFYSPSAAFRCNLAYTMVPLSIVCIRWRELLRSKCFWSESRFWGFKMGSIHF